MTHLGYSTFYVAHSQRRPATLPPCPPAVDWRRDIGPAPGLARPRGAGSSLSTAVLTAAFTRRRNMAFDGILGAAGGHSGVRGRTARHLATDPCPAPPAPSAPLPSSPIDGPSSPAISRAETRPRTHTRTTLTRARSEARARGPEEGAADACTSVPGVPRGTDARTLRSAFRVCVWACAPDSDARRAANRRWKCQDCGVRAASNGRRPEASWASRLRLGAGFPARKSILGAVVAARASIVTNQQRRAQSGRSGRKTERDRKTGVCLGCGRVFAATAPSMVRPSLNKQKSYVHWRELWRMAFLGVWISSLIYSEQCGRLRLRGSQTLTDVRWQIARAHHESACFCYKLSPWQKQILRLTAAALRVRLRLRALRAAARG